MTNWEALHHQAMIETDGARLRERIDAAEEALIVRLLWLWENCVALPQEQLAIREARMNLEVLRRELCGPIMPPVQRWQTQRRAWWRRLRTLAHLPNAEVDIQVGED